MDIDGAESYSDYLVLNNKPTELLDIAIFPNPVRDILNVEIISEGNKIATIYNIQGKEIRTFSINGMTSLDISDLSTGIYYMKVLDYPTMKINKL